jgi:hypothetical protein
MFEKFLYRITDNLAERLLVCGLVVTVPMGFTGAWLGAAYNQVYAGAVFQTVLTGLFFGGMPFVLLGGLLILYPFERWIVRDRAMQSWKWVFIRLLVYMLAGIPEGYVTGVGIHLALWEFPHIVENIFYVQAIVGSFTFGVLYTLVERAVAEVRKREEAYKTQIQSLRIEIDQMKRERQVNEIVETDFFNNLRQKAQDLRKRADGVA